MEWADRAAQGWSALVDGSIRGLGSTASQAPPVARGRGGARVTEPGSRRRVAAWPLSQVLWASTAMDALGRARGATPDALWPALRWYRSGQAYLDNRPLGKRYYDDNAWIGLVAAQQRRLLDGRREPGDALEPWRRRASRMAAFTARGWQWRPSGSGVLWVEGGDTLNACSTGGAGLLAWAVSRQGSESPGIQLVRARQGVAARDFLSGPLMWQDGLVADHLRRDGTVEPSVWLYNQGLLLALLDHIGDPGAASPAAAALVEAVASGFSRAQLEAQPTVFACIWWRALLAHRARLGETEVPEVGDYLDRAWSRGRDGAGFLIGYGRYDEGRVIDHAALVGLAAAYALGPGVWAELL